MHIIYGVVGEGMGHATRSRVILEHLLAAGHTLTVVVSGRAHAFLKAKLGERPGLRVEEIHGLHLKFDGNDLDLSESVLSNMKLAPAGLRKNLKVWAEIVDADALLKPI